MKRYPHRSKRAIRYHGRVGHPLVHKKGKRTYIMVRKRGGGTKRLYNYKNLYVK